MTTPKDNLQVNANLAEALELLNGLGHRYAAEAREFADLGEPEGPWEESSVAGVAKFGAALIGEISRHNDIMQAIEKHLERIAQGVRK